MWGAWWARSTAAAAASAGTAALPWDPDDDCILDEIDEADRCRYVQHVSDCESPSRIQYLEVAYCHLGGDFSVVFLLLVLWLGFLFVNLVLVVDSRVVPNINTVAKCLGMSDSLAGVTLLALGNGAADVFSAAAAVSASERGADLAISGLLGGGLYVVAVVAGVLAYVFEPDITLMKTGCDAGWYLLAIACVALMASDGKLRLWECTLFILMYCVYVVYVLIAERIDETYTRFFGGGGDGDEERTALLPGPGAENALNLSAWAPVDVSASGRSPLAVPVLASASSSSSAGGGGGGDAYGGNGVADSRIPSDGTLACTIRRLGAELVNCETTRWGDKSAVLKAVAVVQLPVHLVLVLTNPVVFNDDRGRSWDRNLHVAVSALMIPFVVLIFDDDAFYSEGIDVPSLVYAAVLGVVLAVGVGATAPVGHPPRYQPAFAGAGFVVALAWIYAVSDEVVASLTAAGRMLSISPSLLGMTVLGIGNGTCDLVANYLMAKAGFPSIALAAVYAGPMFNLLFGLGVAGIAGSLQYGHGLPVTADSQLYVGVVFIVTALTLGVGFSATAQFTKRHGVTLFALYGAFVVASVVAYVAAG